jgi:protein-L-isoaspartate(D-aspartate) O-methyltransferase
VAKSGEARDVGRVELLLALRRQGISDQAVLRAMDEVPRERFVEPQDAAMAYADRALPVSCGQTISQPYVVAYMTEQLAVQPHHRVLEIGAGSGYQTAVLSRLAREVVTIERYRTLADKARERLAGLGFDNVEVVAGDGLIALPGQGAFDRILVTAAGADIPQSLIDQLADGGVLIMPVGPAEGTQRIVKVTHTAQGLKREDLIAVRFVPLLPGAAREL